MPFAFIAAGGRGRRGRAAGASQALGGRADGVPRPRRVPKHPEDARQLPEVIAQNTFFCKAKFSLSPVENGGSAEMNLNANRCIFKEADVWER